MQLRAQFSEDGDLQLTAATYGGAEFTALHDVLERAGSFLIKNPLEMDRSKRMIQEYRIPRKAIKQLERILGGKFDEEGSFAGKSPQRGRRYACTEITTRGHGRGCETIVAIDDSIALVKCALIAGRNNWFGGMAKAGACADRT
jgi:hypothetical protein